MSEDGKQAPVSEPPDPLRKEEWRVEYLSKGKTIVRDFANARQAQNVFANTVMSGWREGRVTIARIVWEAVEIEIEGNTDW